MEAKMLAKAKEIAVAHLARREQTEKELTEKKRENAQKKLKIWPCQKSV